MISNHQSQNFIKDNSKGKYLKVSRYHHYLKQCNVTKIFFKSLIFLYFLLFSLMVKDLISQFCSSINIFLKCIILFYLLFSRNFTWMEIPNISKSANKLPSWIWRFMTLLDMRLIRKPNKCAADLWRSWYWQEEQSWHGKTQYDKLVHATKMVTDWYKILHYNHSSLLSGVKTLYYSTVSGKKRQTLYLINLSSAFNWDVRAVITDHNYQYQNQEMPGSAPSRNEIISIITLKNFSSEFR